MTAQMILVDKLREQYADDLVEYVKCEWPELPARKIVDETFRIADSRKWDDPRKNLRVTLWSLAIDRLCRAEAKTFPLFA